MEEWRVALGFPALLVNGLKFLVVEETKNCLVKRRRWQSKLVALGDWQGWRSVSPSALWRRWTEHSHCVLHSQILFEETPVALPQVPDTSWWWTPALLLRLPCGLAGNLELQNKKPYIFHVAGVRQVAVSQFHTQSASAATFLDVPCRWYLKLADFE